MEFEVPEEMLRRGRPENQDFSNTEALYRRVHPDYFRPELGPIPVYAVELPNTSVNRQSPNGKPEFVLYDVKARIHRRAFGVVAINCEHVPFQSGIDLAEPKSARTVVEHHPLDENYFHSEIRVRDAKNEIIPLPNSELSNYRVRVRSKLRVIRKAD